MSDAHLESVVALFMDDININADDMTVVLVNAPDIVQVVLLSMPRAHLSYFKCTLGKLASSLQRVCELSILSSPSAFAGKCEYVVFPSSLVSSSLIICGLSTIRMNIVILHEWSTSLLCSRRK